MDFGKTAATLGSPSSPSGPNSQSPKTPSQVKKDNTGAGDSSGRNNEESSRFGALLQMQAGAGSVRSPAQKPSVVTPFGLLVQGVEQTIEIPLKTILMKVMQMMPAKKAPFIKCVNAGPSGYQVCVELDVSGSRFTVEPSTTVAKVMGDVCITARESVDSAVVKAFEYLEKKHFIQVVDYSSNVVEEYDCKSAWGDVNACSYVTEKVLRDWSVAIDSIGKFCGQLEMKEAAENMYGVRSAAGDRYYETKNFVASLLSRYITKHRTLNLEFMRQEGKRSAYLKECNDKTNAILLKGYKQAVQFSEKDVLDYVLKFLGLKEAEYNNKPLVESGLFRGEVEIWLPKVEEAGCGGRTKFKGANLLTAATDEEDAAAKALRYLESKLKIKVVDKNYADRVDAKEKHLMLIKLLREFLRTADQVKTEWSTMVSYMEDGVGIFGDSLQSYSVQSPGDAEVAAVKFCSEGMCGAHRDCASAFEAAAAKIDAQDKYYPKEAHFEE